MNLTGGIVLYAVIWFLVLFVLLPIRERSQQEDGHIVPGTHAGAPADFRMRRKLIWTTVIATVLWAVIASVILSGRISLSDIDWFDRMGQR